MSLGRISVPGSAKKGEVIEVRVIIQHPMETGFRFDLKGSGSEVSLQGEELLLVSNDEFKLKAVKDILEGRLVKRGVPLKAL